MLQRTLTIGALMSTLVACASTRSPRGLSIISDPPGAQVSLIQANGETRELGSTPYEYSESQLAAHRGELYGFRFQKEGFEVERVYVENPTNNFQGELKVKLRPSGDWSQAFVDQRASKYLNDVAQLTAEVQGAIASKDLSRGEQKARALTTRYPNIAVGWGLLGNVLYKQNRRSEALEAYTKALGLDPNNQETKAVVESLRGM